MTMNKVLRQQNAEEYDRRYGEVPGEDEGQCQECGFDIALGDCQRCIDVARARDKKRGAKSRYKRAEIW